jgi:hypothetical protein
MGRSRPALPWYFKCDNVAVVQWLVQWENLSPEEATWEDADFIKESFPAFFKTTVQS